MYSKAIQLYMCTPVFRLFSMIVCYKVWDLAPCATEEVLVYFTGSSVAASPGLLAYKTQRKTEKLSRLEETKVTRH